jgi:hypothetical protein
MERRKSWRWLVLLLPVGLAAAIVWFQSTVVQPAAATSSCDARLGSIGSYFHLYHKMHGHFPPAVEYDATGKPKHSWRILLLKAIVPDSCREYDLSLPWDNPANQRLSSRTPEMFSCPIGRNSGDTSFVLVVGPGAVYPKADARPVLADIIGSHHLTAFMIESIDSGINWLEPKDASRADAFDLINAPSPNSRRTRTHQAGVGLLLLTQSVIRIRPNMFKEGQLAVLFDAVGDKSPLDSVVRPSGPR